MTRIYSLGLLPPTVVAMEGEDIVAATARMPRPAAPKSSTGSFMSRAFSRRVLHAELDSALLPSTLGLAAACASGG